MPSDSKSESWRVLFSVRAAPRESHFSKNLSKTHKNAHFEKVIVRTKNFSAAVLNLLPQSDIHKTPVFIGDY
jgi:hypothetical protein